MTRHSRKTTRHSRIAHLVTVRILVDADNPKAAWDVISGHLTDRGIYGEHAAILDWNYCEDSMPLTVRIPEHYEPDSIDLDELAAAKGGAS